MRMVRDVSAINVHIDRKLKERLVTESHLTGKKQWKIVEEGLSLYFKERRKEKNGK